jgi:hypothetical protein
LLRCQAFGGFPLFVRLLRCGRRKPSLFVRLLRCGRRKPSLFVRLPF